MSLLFHLPLDVSALLELPERDWNEPATDRWLSLCHHLSEFSAPLGSPVNVFSADRKWEVVSAFQKCIRRGLVDRALPLVDVFHSADRESRRYFWRRLCTTAAEDVGFGDPELMNFAVACSMAFGSHRTSDERLRNVWTFLTQQMCGATRSRIYCQLSIIEGHVRRGRKLTGMTDCQQALVHILAEPDYGSAKQRWSDRNNWRAEGMLHFQQCAFSDVASAQDIGADFQPGETLMNGLPSFAYDWHTRVGRNVCARVAASEPFSGWFGANPTATNSAEVVGWALFFVEGGLLRNAVTSPQVNALEQRYVAASFEYEVATWIELLHLLNRELRAGSVDSYRQAVLAAKRSSSSGSLFSDAV